MSCPQACDALSHSQGASSKGVRVESQEAYYEQMLRTYQPARKAIRHTSASSSSPSARASVDFSVLREDTNACTAASMAWPQRSASWGRGWGHRAAAL
jgi:hypothetical protein